MEAKELRIGNIVNFGIVLEPIIIKGITEQSSTIEMAEPIPLTEEWLLKFGFIFINDKDKYGWFLNVSKNRVLMWCHSKEISLDFDYDNNGYNNTLFNFNCEYVHQLQNLFFALTGEELTIK